MMNFRSKPNTYSVTAIRLVSPILTQGLDGKYVAGKPGDYLVVTEDGEQLVYTELSFDLEFEPETTAHALLSQAPAKDNGHFYLPGTK